MKYKAVLFDMDGTVLDTLTDLCDAVNYTMKHFGYPEISMKQCGAYLGNGARHLISCAAPKDADIDAVLEYYLPYYASHCLIKSAPYPGIMDMLLKLKKDGVKMAIISNKPDKATKELANIFFDNIVDFAVGESEVVKRKPNPDAVLAAVDEFGLDISECVYIGDTEVDIETAKNAGMDVIAVLWGFRTLEELKNSGAKVFAETADELYGLLN